MDEIESRYVEDVFTGRRRTTREVRVGDVGIGGANPLRVQSMTNTDTRDIRGTADQIEQLAAVGCEIVRITVPSIRDAEVLPEIRAELAKRKLRVPLVADIHFTPNAAMLAADYVEKIRINPGNYVDKKKFEVREFSDAQYESEVERVGQRFRPLVLRCKERGVAMRIGTNHGSLSDRIMNRFGDTPLGMVESALEFLDVCEAENYYDIVFSMKASNTQVAIQAYRLLAQRLDTRDQPPGGTYPFHIGITEAGDSEDGRIKSAIGIGALLEDGIGDTIRVSLTEHPVREVPVAEALAERASKRWAADASRSRVELAGGFTPDPYDHLRRPTRMVECAGLGVGGSEPVRVELDFGRVQLADIAEFGEARAKELEKLGDLACESLRFALDPERDDVPAFLTSLAGSGWNAPVAAVLPRLPGAAPDLLPTHPGLGRWVMPVTAEASDPQLRQAVARVAEAGVPIEWALRAPLAELALLVDRVLAASGSHEMLLACESDRANHAARILSARLREMGAEHVPIVLRHTAEPDASLDAQTIAASIDLGAPLCDGIGDLVSLSGIAPADRAADLAYRVLQGARLRTTRTEFISCPSCGRTLFDLEEVTARIKARTDHLKGVKIAIMGCIVNGPGEMADADFGYVGSGVGKITLYVGKQVVVRSIDEAQATDRLVELIQDAGRWVDPA